jgi:hypothetical protein
MATADSLRVDFAQEEERKARAMRWSFAALEDDGEEQATTTASATADSLRE